MLNFGEKANREDVAEIFDYINRGKKINAIQVLRRIYPLGLREAKELCDDRKRLEEFLQGMTKTHFSRTEQKEVFRMMLLHLESSGECQTEFHDLAEDLFDDRMGES